MFRVLLIVNKLIQILIFCAETRLYSISLMFEPVVIVVSISMTFKNENCCQIRKQSRR